MLDRLGRDVEVLADGLVAHPGQHAGADLAFPLGQAHGTDIALGRRQAPPEIPRPDQEGPARGRVGGADGGGTEELGGFPPEADGIESVGGGLYEAAVDLTVEHAEPRRGRLAQRPKARQRGLDAREQVSRRPRVVGGTRHRRGPEADPRRGEGPQRWSPERFEQRLR
ncbi:MAG: hypothetical protein HYU28_05160 [Actinobacteria bacterium]|nr:hypothetical protein [Actinomycetota bacterium]